MTNELEKQFFDTFGIKPRACIASCSKCQHYSYDYCLSGYCTLDSDYDNCGVAEKQYPQITDRILLRLICICCKAFNLLNIELSVVFAFNIDEIKQSILTRLIWLDEVYHNKGIKHQVFTLFEEG